MIVPLTEKQKLRQEFRALRAAEKAKNSSLSLDFNLDAIVKTLCLSPNMTIGLYMPTPNEIDITPLTDAFTRAGFTIAMPKTNGQSMDFILCDDTTKFAASILQISEPQAGDIIIPDIIFAPCVAVDLQGTRLGQGGGFYDRYAAENPHIKMGAICFEIQISDANLPREKHDKKMDFIVTEQRILTL